jgi:hypothetical protein
LAGQALTQLDGLQANGALQLLARLLLGRAAATGRARRRLPHLANRFESFHVSFVIGLNL